LGVYENYHKNLDFETSLRDLLHVWVQAFHRLQWGYKAVTSAAARLVTE